MQNDDNSQMEGGNEDSVHIGEFWTRVFPASYSVVPKALKTR